MESSEMSLIEISGEDDLLLQQLPADDFSSFGVSPLQIPRSHCPPDSGTREADSRVFDSASSYNNKENLSTNDNKSGIRNLSIERQKMKKSRKAGGYNLRKSLAWDRAFLTEEGVLDSAELSMISRISHGDSLSVVDEERRDSMTLSSDVVRDSANMENLRENLCKELPSGKPSKINTGSSLLKRDSLSGSHLPMASRSSQKVPTGRVLNKTASKGAVCPIPIASPSQKRLLNTGTTVMTRNSKIPRVPLSKHPPSPATTNMHTRLAGGHLKSSGIAQPAQKSISLKLPSNTKYASKASNISSVVASKPIKQLGSSTRKVSTYSNLQVDSSTNHNAQITNKVSNHLRNNSNQSLPIKMVESVDGTRKTRLASHLQSDNGGGKRRVEQVQGIKPSGLRMPSPSMRFFSEGNMKSSNLKSCIPTSRNSEAANHSADFKQIKVRHGALNDNAISKTRILSQVTEICSTSSPVNPTAQTEATYGKCSQQVVRQRGSLVDKIPHQTKKVKWTENVLNDIDSQQSHEIPISAKDEESDMKYNLTLSHTDSVDINLRDPDLQQNEYSSGNVMETSYQSCPEGQLTVASAIKGEVCPTPNEETGCSSSAMADNGLLESETELNRDHNNLTLVADRDPFIGMYYDDKNPGDSKINDLQESNTGESMNLQLGGTDLLADGKCPPEMDEGDYNRPTCVGRIADVQISKGEKQGSFSDGEQIRSCSANCGIVDEVTYEHVDKDQVDVIFDGELSTMKLGECLLEQDNVSSDDSPYQEDCSFLYEDKSPSMKPKRCGVKEICDVVSILREPELKGRDHSRISSLELPNSRAAGIYDLPFSTHGAEELPLSWGHEIVGNGCQRTSPVASINGTDVTINPNIQVTQQVLNENLVVKLPTAERDGTYLTNEILLKNSSLHGHRDNSIEISDDIHYVHSSVGEVKSQIDSNQFTDLEAHSSASRSKDQGTMVAADSVSEASACLEIRHDLSPKEVSVAADPVSEASACLEIRHDLSPRQVLVSPTPVIRYDKCSVSREESEMRTSQLIDSLTMETQSNMESIGCRDEENENLKRSGNLKIILPASDAVPFSDEWLAALESAGEEILTLKTGAVQHSPPDKAVPEPSPWSPVKRKTNQVIGPYDCTKYTNIQPDQPE